jgi:hypothetical protein
MNKEIIKNLTFTGIVLIAAAFVLTFAFKVPGNWTTGVLMGVGLIDVILVVRKWQLARRGDLDAANKIKTISTVIQDRFSRKKDFIIFAVIMGLIWWQGGQSRFNDVLLGSLLGHFFLYSK